MERSPLRSVKPPTPAPAAPAVQAAPVSAGPPPEPPPDPAAGLVRDGVESVLAALDVSERRTAPALRALAQRLADACDSVASQFDPRVLAAAARELRATLSDLEPPAKEGEAGVDLFDVSGGPSLVVSPAG